MKPTIKEVIEANPNCHYYVWGVSITGYKRRKKYISRKQWITMLDFNVDYYCIYGNTVTMYVIVY